MNGIFYIVQINPTDPKINLRSKYKIGKLLLSEKEFTNDIISLGGELLFTILLSMIFFFIRLYKQTKILIKLSTFIYQSNTDIICFKK